MERFHGRYLRLEATHYHRIIPVLTIDVDTKTVRGRQRITTVARSAIIPILDQPGIVIDDDFRKPPDARTSEHRSGRCEGERLELAVNLHLHGLAGDEQQVRNALRALDDCH